MKVAFIFCCYMQFFFESPLPDPVHWQYSARKLAAGLVEVKLVGTITRNWHIYSRTNTNAPGPIQIKFFKQRGLRMEGGVKELNQVVAIQDPYFSTTTKAIYSRAEYTQQVLVKNGEVNTVEGSVTYIACNGQNCLPPKTDTFRVSLP